jgi:uncharacterized membrane protein/thiol-disulfide isomerase/thioredoxin
MKYRLFCIWAVCCLLGLTVLSSVTLAGSTDSKVHAVLFFSPVCPHCHKVITELLQPLIAQYGEKLDIVGVNTTSPEGQTLFQSAIQSYNIPEGRRGVPIMIIWNYVLVAPEEIVPGFPTLVKTFLEQGGVEFPPVPGLREQIAKDRAQAAQNANQAGTPNPALAAPYAQELSLRMRLARDPVGNSMAIAMLAGMLVVFGRVVLGLRRSTLKTLSAGRDWPIPILSLIGLAIAGYLAYAGVAKTVAICGPVGDCNLVQQSKYARLFGVVPVTFIGVAGYAAIICAWALARRGHGRIAQIASRTLLAATFAGTILSVYLTFLEPFVIGAACLWCLVSAAVMTALLWCSARLFGSGAVFPDLTGVAAPSSEAPNAIRPRKPRRKGSTAEARRKDSTTETQSSQRKAKI